MFKPGDSNVILKILWARVFHGVEFPKLKIGATWSNVLFLCFIRNQSYKLITHVINPFTKHFQFVLEYSYLCARCGLKLQNGDTNEKIKCNSFPSTDERAFGMGLPV